MEANADTWCTVDALAKCYTPCIPLRNVEVFKKHVTITVLAHFPRADDMLEGVEWEKLRAYYLAQRV